jgi:hypothetical protein
VYRNRFRGVPAGLPYRPPRRTPRPAIRGYQSAIVVCPGLREVDTDKHGRVKLQFHWDRQGRTNWPDHAPGKSGTPLTLEYWKARGENAPATSSGWVRVAHAWAGQGWGQFALPRIGQEVAVLFLDGDPDRPLVIGSLYNNINPPPFRLPAHALASGWKSHTSGDDPNAFNGLAFHDSKGHENVHLHAQRNLNLSAHQHLVTNVGGHWFENIQGHRLQCSGTPSVAGLTEAGSQERPDQPWQWTIGPVASGVVASANLGFGFALNAICGASGTVVVGNNTVVTINPLETLRGVPAWWLPNLTTLLSTPGYALDGMNNLSLGPMLSLTLGNTSMINLGPTFMVQFSDKDPGHVILKVLCQVLALLSAAGIVVLGGLGDRLKADLADKNQQLGAGIKLGLGSTLLGAVALSTLLTAMVVLYRTQTMTDSLEALKESLKNQNLSVVNFIHGIRW